ncbi:Bug family tripartite tricarboxylate transporter substrate binding protein [Azohydromonas lata]|uniref:Tripartite tricarboxylate transporter substrate binding protein n=1 Tax=Azohydromonas lata TaxID=45677 RepID=A0ABU5IH34_9BURK|nr:tripartite tricarboxylate transporter substrate binding protein [Azohydromonas lata]MDZ5458457.1 tripartite tricarboxylate transporter substrate binding protein [Azohydromonas lata]
MHHFTLPASPGVPRRGVLALGALLLAGASAPLQAQPAYPAKPVTLVVAFSPGGPNDVMARILAGKLSANLGQQFIVENKVGAGGTIGTAQVAKAPADGYTLLFNSAPFVTAPALYGSRLSYDTLRDFTGITKVAESPLALMTATHSPHKSLKGLIATAKAQPGKLNFGSGGVASTSHLAMALLDATAGMELQHVPYKGGGQSITALMGGEIDVLLDSITAGGAFLSSGKLRALAVTGNKRSPKQPDAPTFAEAGLPEFQMVHWVGLSAPAKTPPPVLDKLQREVAKAMAAEDVKARFAELGAEPAVGPREQFDEFIKAEVGRWTRVIHDARIQAE